MADTPQKIDLGHYMALGMVWYGAKYSHVKAHPFMCLPVLGVLLDSEIDAK